MKKIHYFAPYDVTLNSTDLVCGAPLYVFYRKGMPISMRAVFLSGARFENIPGTAHITEHMIVSGSADYPSRELLTEAVESIGGYKNAYTGPNTMAVVLNFGKQVDMPKAVDILENILSKPLFKHDVFDKEKGAILSEYRENRSDATWYGWELYAAQAFEGSKLAESTIGTEESINSISLETVKDFYKNNITSGRMVIIAAGDIDINTLEQELNNKLTIGFREKFTALPPLPIPTTKKIFMHEQFRDVHQTHIALGFRLPKMTPLESIAMQIVATIFGSGGTSRLMKSLRQEHGLVYHAGAHFSSGPDYDEFTIATSCKPEDTEKVFKILSEEINNLIKKGITQEEFEKEKNYISKSEPSRFQTSDSWVSAGSELLLYNEEELPYFLNFDEYLSKLTLEEVQTCIKRVMKKEYLFGSTTGPTEKGFNSSVFFA